MAKKLHMQDSMLHSWEKCFLFIFFLLNAIVRWFFLAHPTEPKNLQSIRENFGFLFDPEAAGPLMRPDRTVLLCFTVHLPDSSGESYDWSRDHDQVKPRP